MGISKAVFESAGKRTEHLIPGVYSRSNNVSSSGTVSAGNLVILGHSTGGKPNTLLSFSTLAEAKDALVSGELLNGVAHAFVPSSENRPQRVYAMRVNEGTQSSITLASGGQDILEVKAWDYGVHTNQLKLLIEAGTEDNTKKLSVAYKTSTISYDNIGKQSFALSYIGENTNPEVTITPTNFKANAINESSETADEITASFTDFETVDSLVAFINDSDAWTATLIDSDSNSKTSDLDSVSNVSVTTDVTLTSNLKAFIDTLESCSYVGSVKLLSNTRVVPEDTVLYKYFTGGTAGTSDISAWSKTLGFLEAEDIQIISTTSTNSSIQNLIAQHCSDMSSTENRKERTCILGGALGIIDDDAVTIARGFNSKYVSFVADGIIASNPLTGDTETFAPSYLACKLAGLESSLSPSEPLTNKDVSVSGFTSIRKKSSIEKLISNGILCVNITQDNRYAVIRSLTTYQSDDLMLCERSMVREDLYMNRDLRNRFAAGIGHVNDVSTDAIVTTLKNAAKEWRLNNYIVQNGADDVWDISVNIDGDKVYLTFSRYLAAPRNFVFITSNNYTYSTTTVAV